MSKFSDSDTICVFDSCSSINEPRAVSGIARFKWLLRASAQSSTTFNIITIGANVSISTTFFLIRDGLNPHRLGSYELNTVGDGDHNICTLYISNGKTVQCDVTFTVHWEKRTVFAPLGVHEMIEPSNSRCSDAVITVEKQDIKIHRGFMSMISPVFSAAFGPDTKETKTGILDIKDFSFETVKNAIDYCYGHFFANKTAAEVTDMLRFYDKYDIQAPIQKLEAWIPDNFSNENFFPIVKYAWQHSKEHLQTLCGYFYHYNAKDLACHPELGKLEPDVIVAVVRAGIAAGSKK